MNLNKYLKEVDTALSRAQGPEKTCAYIARYVGGVKHEKRKPDEQSRLRFYGLQVGAQRAIFKRGFSFMKSADEFRIWDHIFKSSEAWEVKNMALFFVRKQKAHFYRDQWPALKQWVHHIDNWAHSDELSHIYSKLLEENFKLLKPFFEQMNRSQNPWLRRQSVVGLLNYSRLRKKYPPKPWMIQLIQNLLDDPHVYVQKGVGWALREIHNIDPELQEKFVKTHLARISPTAWYAATENYSAAEKKKLVELRKTARQKKRKS